MNTHTSVAVQSKQNHILVSQKTSNEKAEWIMRRSMTVQAELSEREQVNHEEEAWHVSCSELFWTEHTRITTSAGRIHTHIKDGGIFREVRLPWVTAAPQLNERTSHWLHQNKHTEVTLYKHMWSSGTDSCSQSHWKTCRSRCYRDTPQNAKALTAALSFQKPEIIGET